MLGITTPDAIALGTLILAVLAALTGKKSGDAAKKTDPVHPTSPNTLGDIELLVQAISLNTGAVNKLTAVVEHEAKRHEVDDEVQKALDVREVRLLIDQLKHARGTGAGP